MRKAGRVWLPKLARGADPTLAARSAPRFIFKPGAWACTSPSLPGSDRIVEAQRHIHGPRRGLDCPQPLGP